MTRPLFVSLLTLTSLVGSLARSAEAQGTTIGTLSIVRQVQVTRTRATPELRERVERDLASQGEPVFEDQLIRTLKRSAAEVVFKRGTIARFSERTEAIVQESSLYLHEGKAWVQAGTGSFQIKTPTCSIELKGATVEVRVTKDATRLYCYRGSAVLTRDGRTITVNTGELSGVVVEGTQVTLESAIDIPGDQRPSDQGGSRPAWWLDVARERGLRTLPGSLAGAAIRSSGLTESLQAALNAPPPPQDIVQDPANKARLLALSQATVVPEIERTLASDPTLTLGGYRQRFGGADLSERYSLADSDLSFLRGNGVGNVRELFDALNAAGATFGVDLRSQNTPATSRLVYRPSAWRGASNPRRPLFDGAKRSNNLIFLGAAAAALLDRDAKTSAIAADVDAFGFTVDPQGIGGRLRLYGSLGKSHYQFEGNVLRLLSGANTRSYDALSVASIERELGTGLTAFIGRRRFYSGPALLSLERSQLLGERYSAIGANLRHGAFHTEAAWLYDSNPDVRGAQPGFLASTVRSLSGGTVGAQLLKAGGLSTGFGYTVSGSLPLSKQATQIDGYAEVGVAPDKASIATLGFYFPWIYQTSDLDVFAEYSTHQSLGSSTTITVNKELSGGASLRAFVGQRQQNFIRSQDIFGGIGLSYPLNRR